MVMQDNDLTVVLTLKDRSSFTYRWMRWMDDQRFPYKILIADGGSDDKIEKHLKDRHNYPDLDYEYIRYPYDWNVEMFVRKLADVAERVTTEYVMAVDNDDLILLEPLEENLRVMRDRRDVHTLGPAHYRFKIHKDVRSADEIVFADNARVSFVRLSLPADPALEDVDPLKRLLTVVEKFYGGSIWYGIHRSDDYKRINHGLQVMGVRRLLFIEWYTIYSYAVAGKMVLGRTKPCLLRQDGTSQVAGAMLPEETHSSVFLSRDWSSHLYGMIDDLYLWCADMGYKLDPATFEERFRVEFRKYMLRYIEFRGLADRFATFPTLYALGRQLFSLYWEPKRRSMSYREIEKSQALRRAKDFLSAPVPG